MGDGVVGAAAVIVAVVGVGGLALAAVATAALVRTLREVRDAVELLRAEALPAVSELRAVIRRTDTELGHLEEVLESASSVAGTVDATSRLVYLAVSNPVIKGAALAAGSARAIRRLRGR